MNMISFLHRNLARRPELSSDANKTIRPPLPRQGGKGTGSPFSSVTLSGQAGSSYTVGWQAEAINSLLRRSAHFLSFFGPVVLQAATKALPATIPTARDGTIALPGAPY